MYWKWKGKLEGFAVLYKKGRMVVKHVTFFEVYKKGIFP